MTFSPTPQQDAVDRALALTSDNLLVTARAGTGKTTTMVWLIHQILRRHPGARVLAMAFNRVIADELQARLPRCVEARTFHSLCSSACRRAAGAQPSDQKMQEIIAHWVGQMDACEITRGQVVKETRPLIGLVYATRTDPDDEEAVTQMAADYDQDLEQPALTLPLLANVIRTARSLTKAVSYDCMIDHVLVHDYPVPTYDYVFVDEAQDLNRAFLHIVEKTVKNTGRLIAVADEFQAIYQFRGADHRSVQVIRERFNCTTLPLSVTFRCATAIVEKARQLVPDYEAAPTNPEGVVDERDADYCTDTLREVPPGTLLLCRTNAPLIRWCMWCIRHGIQAYVRGRDIGKELTRLLEQADRGKSLDDTLINLRARAQRKAARLRSQDRERAAEALMDKVQSVEEIADAYDTVEQVLRRIGSAYRDKGTGLQFSTVHKAKGLEADTAVILHPELMPPRWIYRYRQDDPERFERLLREEQNIRYVALTRARNRLILQECPRD